MALNFPSSPTIGQVYTDTISGFSYEWDGTVWRSFSPSSSSQIKALDDISGSFDGIETTFPLTSNASQITSPSPQSLIINLGGVIQDPTGDYTVLGSNLIFSTPPTSGLSFSGVSLGPAVPINTITDGTVTDGSLRISTNAVVGSATTFTEDLVVEGDARVTGILTVGTSSLTLNGNTNTINGVTISSGIVTATDVTVGLTTITGSTGNIITPGSVTTGNLQSSSINGGPLAGMRNAIINGDMRIAQRGTAASNVANLAYPCVDRWRLRSSYSGGTTDCEQGNSGPNLSLPNTFKLTHKTTTATVTNQWYSVRQQIEKNNAYRFATGEPFTISFWYKSNRTGNHAVRWDLENTATGTNALVAATFTVNNANIWEFKTVTVDYVPSAAGTGDFEMTGLVLDIGFSVAGQITFDTINVNDYFEFTGVQVEAGPVATPFERRPIGTELALCQRYYEVLPLADHRTCGTSAGDIGFYLPFKVFKRAIPSITFSDIVYNVNSSGLGTEFIHNYGHRVSWNSGNSTIHSVVTFRTFIDAEL
jgi:hypothetical protein